jgi:hypothetical protein
MIRYKLNSRIPHASPRPYPCTDRFLSVHVDKQNQKIHVTAALLHSHPSQIQVDAGLITQKPNTRHRKVSN